MGKDPTHCSEDQDQAEALYGLPYLTMLCVDEYGEVVVNAPLRKDQGPPR